MSIGFTGRMTDQETIDRLECEANRKARLLTVREVEFYMACCAAHCAADTYSGLIDMAIAMACEPAYLPENACCEVRFQ